MSWAVSRVFAEIFCLIILWVRDGQPTSEIQKSAPGCHLTMKKATFEYEYYQEGDVIVGGLFTANTGVIPYDYTDNPFYESRLCIQIDVDEYWNLLAFIFAVDEINKNPRNLPNITLGYHLFDSCGVSQKVVQNVLQILSGNKREAPNYSCHERGKVVGFIGDRWPVTSLPMAQILTLYGYTQISSGSTNPQLSDRALHPYFFRIVPDDQNIYLAILKLLKHFGWNWVGVITSKDEAGERELRELSQVITNSGVCIAFVIKIADSPEEQQKSYSIIKKSNTRVVITTGTCSLSCIVFFRNYVSIFQNITLILAASWSLVIYSDHAAMLTFNGSLSFTSPVYKYPIIKDYFNNVVLSSRPNDPLLEDIKLVKLQCYSQNKKFFIFSRFYKYTPVNCTGNERLTSMFNDTEEVSVPYYFGLYIMALAIHNIHLSRIYLQPNPQKYKYQHKLHNYVQRICVKIDGKRRCFNERGEMPGTYYLANWKISVLGDNKLLAEGHYVGELDTSSLMDQPLHVYEKLIIWKNRKAPRARCNDYCPPGYRKAPNGGYHICCYDCLECSEGEVSNITDDAVRNQHTASYLLHYYQHGTSEDIDNCWKCPDTEWPDESRVTCIPKVYDFLSYQTDIFAHIFTSISIIFTFITILILGIFVLFRHTPVVKANNLDMSFLLLGSIMLSFLCVFLFLGRPVDTTCMLRQTIFSLIFSVSVSSLLAKTVMVYIAFKATKPESSWRKLVGLKVSNSIVLICSCVQVLINVVWLSTSPPFQEFDMHSYPGKIIVQCNEGSVIAFYSALGYMGILAAVSFVLAFMVRTLPDSFNEAKYITFSMLLFCSVWIAMIPAYLSTKGKDMVSVEIFAILASSAGLLGCIFFPKCYILLLKPETNTRKHVLEKNKP